MKIDKMCSKCGQISTHNTKRRQCVACERAYSRDWYLRNRQHSIQQNKQYNAANPQANLIAMAKRRAKENNLPFDLSLHDVIIPAVCPVLGIEIRKGNKVQTDNSPSIDRLIPERGYVKDNIIVVSLLANRVRNNATVDQLQKVVDFYRDKLSERSQS